MPLARVNRTIFYFSHIPKTGGSSIEAHLASVGQVCLMSRRATGFSRVTPQHMESATFDHYVPDTFYDHGFAIVRDPLDRLISEFHHQIRLAKPHHRIAVRLGVPRATKRDTMLAQAQKHVVMRDFDGWCDAIFRACRIDPYICDNHIRPQVDFVAAGHRLFDFHAGLDAVLLWINEVAGVAVGALNTPHEKRTKKRPITVSDETRQRAANFYRADHLLLENIRAGAAGSAGVPVQATTG